VKYGKKKKKLFYTKRLIKPLLKIQNFEMSKFSFSISSFFAIAALRRAFDFVRRRKLLDFSASSARLFASASNAKTDLSNLTFLVFRSLTSSYKNNQKIKFLSCRKQPAFASKIQFHSFWFPSISLANEYGKPSVIA